MFPEYPDIDY